MPGSRAAGGHAGNLLVERRGSTAAFPHAMLPLQRTPAPALPHEILVEILWADVSLAYAATLTYSPSRSSQTAGNRSSVGACLAIAQWQLASHMLVCRDWLHTGRTLLYSTPLISSCSQLHAFRRTTVFDKETSTFRGLIVEDFVIENPDPVMPGHLDKDETNETEGYIEECRSALDGVLALYGSNSFSLHLWANLAGSARRLLAYPLLHSVAASDIACNLRSLSLRGSVMFTQNADSGQNISGGWAFPKLEELSVRETFLPLDFVITSHRLPSLTKLRLMHCHWASTASIFPSTSTGPHLTHLEFMYTMTDDHSLAATVREHAASLTHLTLIGKSELRAFARLVATEASIGDEQLTDPWVGPYYAARGPVHLESLYQLTVSLIASPEARHFDFALGLWSVPPHLEHLVIARRRWSEWRESDFTTKDLIGIYRGLKNHIYHGEQPHRLKKVEVEGTFPSGAIEEKELLHEIAELCSIHDIDYYQTGRTIAEAISVSIASPCWNLNHLA
jgi:hypothetical protein